MPFRTGITAAKLTLISGGLWFCSLFFPVFSLYSSSSHQAPIFGYNILLTGWLALLMLNFAWPANLFFIFAFLKLTAGKKSSISPVIAGILSLDTLRYTEVLLNEAGHTASIYGYGYGAVLWFLSICLMIAAAGKRNQEAGDRTRGAKRYNGLYIFGLILFSIVLGSSGYFAVHDRMIANSREKTRLKGIAFKRNPVCRQENIRPTPGLSLAADTAAITAELSGKRLYITGKPPFIMDSGQKIGTADGMDYLLVEQKGGMKILTRPSGPQKTKGSPKENPLPAVLSRSLTGPLEIISELDRQDRQIFWDSPFFFLNHGQPIVRVNGLDYSWTKEQGSRRIIARYASGEPEARLVAVTSDTEITMQFELPGIPHFFYNWKIEKGGKRTCPEMSKSQTPRELALQRLQLSDKEIKTLKRQKPEPFIRIAPEFVHSIPEHMPGRCESAALLPDLGKTNPESFKLGKPVLIRDTIYFFPEIRSLNSPVFCSQGAVYITHIPQGPSDEGIFIIKISMEDAAVVWRLFAPFRTQQTVMRTTSLLEKNNHLWITVKGRSPTKIDKFAGLAVPLDGIGKDEAIALKPIIKD